MKALVFIDHDIICRHFVMSGAFEPLVAAADVCFVFPEDPAGKRLAVDPSTLALGAPFETLPIDAERQVTWRWMLHVDGLKFRRGGHYASIRRIRRQALGWKAATLLTLAGVPPLSWIFRRFVRRRFEARPPRYLQTLLDRERPDVVIHPSVLDGVFINDLILECRAREIPSVVVMNSWDNPATKRAVIGVPDWLLVWGSQTQDHAVQFLKIERSRAVPFGAAQFDVFREPPRADRARFAAEHDIDPSKRIVLFAGSNAVTDEFATLLALEQAIDDGRIKDTAVVYRPHPWGEGGRDGKRLASMPWRHVKIHAPMREYIARLATGPVGITLPDYRDTHDVLSAVDVVVSPLSTILIEAILHGKPIVAYAPDGNEGSFEMMQKLPKIHFEELLRIPDVAFVRTVEGLVERLPPLVDPVTGPQIGARLLAGADAFVTAFDRPWRERFVEFVETIADEAAHARAPLKVAAE